MKKVNDYYLKQSRFICLRCLKENEACTGMYRKRMREKYHIKDLICDCNDYKKTKNIEVRPCDYYEEILEYAKKIRGKYYTESLKLKTDK